MTYSIRLAPPAVTYLEELDDKDRRIVEQNLRKLEDDPYPRPSSAAGDVERVTVDIMDIATAHRLYD